MVKFEAYYPVGGGSSKHTTNYVVRSVVYHHYADRETEAGSSTPRDYHKACAQSSTITPMVLKAC